MKCPFTYPDGKKCRGYIEKIKLVNSDVNIHLTKDDDVKNIDLHVQADAQIFCSKKGGHSGSPGVPGQLEKAFEELPNEVRDQIKKRLEA